MRELEAATGVGRETVRFYIREGLLPEPERRSRNSAFYTEEHVRRLRAIKRLQEERFLPLAVIKGLLDAEDGERWLDPGSFPGLAAELRARFDGGGGRVPLAEALKAADLDEERLRTVAGTGMIALDGDKTLGARDMAILARLRELREIGFTQENGFGEDDLAFYAQFVRWLVRREMQLFFTHLPREVGEERAIAMAERGVAAINDILVLMRTRDILELFDERRRDAESD